MLNKWHTILAFLRRSPVRTMLLGTSYYSAVLFPRIFLSEGGVGYKNKNLGIN